MRALAELSDIALAAASAGASVIHATIESGFAVGAEVKGFGDYVTATDRAAEQVILTVLRDQTPDFPILAEETAADVALTGMPTWAVDPLDGTTNFLRGYTPGVAVSVGLIIDGQPVVGAVVAAATGDAWLGARGLGAHDASGRPLSVRYDPMSRGVVATGLPFRRPDNRPRYMPVLHGAIDRFEDIRRHGSAALDLTYVAAGTWDGYFELGLSLWDTAAGTVLVREAGGVVTDWAGDTSGFVTSGDILAGSPEWHEQMLDVIRNALTVASPQPQ